MNIDNTEIDTPTILPEIEENIEIAPSITYDDVRSQIARRWTFEMYKPTLEEAIKTEEAEYQTILDNWILEQSKPQEENEEMTEQSIKPEIDMGIRREFYLNLTVPIEDPNLRITSEEWKFDDVKLTKFLEFITEQILSDEELEQEYLEILYEEDRKLAEQVTLDYTLGIGNVTEEDFLAVRSYMQSIDPYAQLARSARFTRPTRPSIFDRYK